MAMYNGAEVFVETLNASGVEHIFYNPGFDVVPLLSVVSRYRESGKPGPQPVMCLDEFTALNAAHGNYMVTGKPQVVLVHAELGTQQVGGAIQQAWWGKIPVLIMAANMVVATRKNWKGEPYDAGAMLRNCLKWDHEVLPGESFHESLLKALQMAASDPMGPVYLTYPMEALSDRVDIPEITAAEPIRLPAASAAALAKAAELLVKAENPLIITGYAGRNPAAVPALVELAETLGARVVTSPVRMNFPASHPLCAYAEPRGKPYFLGADVVLAVDYDIFYAHPRTPPNPETRVIHIDSDFVKQGEPLWNRKMEVAIQADSSIALPALATLVKKSMTAAAREKARERAKQIGAEHLKLRTEFTALAKEAAGQNRYQRNGCLSASIR